MKRKSLIYLMIALFIVASLPLVTAAAPQTNTNVNVMVINNDPAVQKVGDAGGIDWEQGAIEALGMGVPPANAVSRAQARALARRAAYVDAQRNLLETIQGVQVDSETTVKNMAVESDIIKTKLSGLVKGYRVVKEQELPDGSFQVILAVNMHGKGGLSEAIADSTKPAEIVPIPQPSPEFKPPVAAPRIYTGLVVDARSLGLERSMSPLVYDETGRVIYGNMYVDHSYVVANGLVDYAASPGAIELVQSGQSRAGADPVTVKAISLRDHDRNVVVSKADGDMILAASGPSGFLLKCAVVFEN